MDEHAEDVTAGTLLQLTELRLALLERLIEYLPSTRQVGGVRAVPLMQVLLLLTTDCDAENGVGKAALDRLLSALLTEIGTNQTDVDALVQRSLNHEVKLIIMRLFSVFMGRTRAGTRSDEASFLNIYTANALLQSHALDFCLRTLRSLLTYWRDVPAPEVRNINKRGAAAFVRIPLRRLDSLFDLLLLAVLLT